MYPPKTDGDMARAGLSKAAGAEVAIQIGLAIMHIHTGKSLILNVLNN
jgi:hypothetical protein